MYLDYMKTAYVLEYYYECIKCYKLIIRLCQ